MAIYHLNGRVTAKGKLEVKLPKDIPPGEVRVTLEAVSQPEERGDIPWEDRAWTDEEIAEMLKVEPKTGAEIIAEGLVGGWEDKGITDPVEWIDEQRRRRRERRE